MNIHKVTLVNNFVICIVQKGYEQKYGQNRPTLDYFKPLNKTSTLYCQYNVHINFQLLMTNQSG